MSLPHLLFLRNKTRVILDINIPCRSSVVVGDVSNGEYVRNFLLCSTSYNRAIAQSTIVACGVSLSNAAQVYIVKPPAAGRRSQGHFTESVGTTCTSVCCHRACPAAAVQYSTWVN